MSIQYPIGSSPDAAARAIAAMMQRAQDLTPAMKVGAEAVQRLIQKSFQDSKTPTGAAWDALSSKTIARRRQQSNKPLIDTGRLRQSIATSHGARTITFGTNAPYAGYQQFGTRYIPARPFLPMTSNSELTLDGPAKVVFERIKAQVGNYIANGRLV